MRLVGSRKGAARHRITQAPPGAFPLKDTMKLLLLLPLFLLAGCAGTFGHTSFTVKANGIGGYDLDAKDGKEYSGRNVQFDAKNGTLLIQEGQSKAFQGQSIGATLNPLPTIGLDKILAPK